MSSKLEKLYATSQWENEGGAMMPSTVEAEIGHTLAAHGINLLQPPLPIRKPRSSKLPADTAIGCRNRAAADLVASRAMPTGKGRLRMEVSAASWATRAKLLQRDEDAFEAQRKFNR